MLWLTRKGGGQGLAFLLLPTSSASLFTHTHMHTISDIHSMSLYFLLLLSHRHLHTLRRNQCIKTIRSKSWICKLHAKYTYTHSNVATDSKQWEPHTGSEQLRRVTQTRITKKKRTIPAVPRTQNTARTSEPENICWVGTNKTTSRRRTGSSGGLRKHI